MKVKAYLHAQYLEHREPGEKFIFVIYPSEMNDYGYLLLGTVEIEVADIAEKDLILAQIQMLKGKEQKIQAQAFQACAAIQHEIGKLLAIEAPKRTDEDGERI